MHLDDYVISGKSQGNRGRYCQILFYDVVTTTPRWFGIAGWCVVFLCKLLSVFQGNLVLVDCLESSNHAKKKKNGVFFWVKKIYVSRFAHKNAQI